MNSVKLQNIKSICKNQLYLYIVITNYQKGELRKQSHLPLHQKNKIPRKKLNQEGEKPVH